MFPTFLAAQAGVNARGGAGPSGFWDQFAPSFVWSLSGYRGRPPGLGGGAGPGGWGAPGQEQIDGSGDLASWGGGGFQGAMRQLVPGLTMSLSEFIAQKVAGRNARPYTLPTWGGGGTYGWGDDPPWGFNQHGYPGTPGIYR